MTNPRAPMPVDLIPAAQQTLWGTPAVMNFAAGGAGAGLYLVASLGAGFTASPALTLASWLAPALVLIGFIAVAIEAGRPLRGPRVLMRIRSSWMSRELWLGGAFVALAGAELVAPRAGWRVLAAGAATMLVVAQGFILCRARGVAAWNVTAMPALFLVSAAVSGMGLYLLLEVAAGRQPGNWLLGSTMALLVFGFVAWLTFVTWSAGEAFVRATGLLREGATAIQLAGCGYVVPFLLVGLGLALPGWRQPLVVLAAACMLAGQLHAKAVIILKAGQLRAVTLTSLRLSQGALTHPRGALTRPRGALTHPRRSS